MKGAASTGLATRDAPPTRALPLRHPSVCASSLFVGAGFSSGRRLSLRRLSCFPDFLPLHVSARLEGITGNATREDGELPQDANRRPIPVGDRAHLDVHRGRGRCPWILGEGAAVCFAPNFRLCGLARTTFVLPVMAAPVAVALVWTMMFHPQLGVLNYLISLIGLPPSARVCSSTTVIPILVMIETWQWSRW